MKKLLYIILACMAFVSCETEAPSSTEPTPLNVTVSGIESFAAYVTVDPEDVRAYYVSSVMKTEQYNSLEYADSHYMMLVIDSLYANYLVWRHSYLRDNTTYFADFKSHCLLRGTTTSFYGRLTPETDYIILSFCVNPISMQPMGKLQKSYFRTTELDTVSVSPMQIDLYVDMYEEKNAYKCLASARPSIDGKPTKNPYFVGFISEEDLVANYANDLKNYVAYYSDWINSDEKIYTQEVLSDIYMDNLDKAHLFEPGKAYYLFAAPLYTWSKSIFYLRFTYKPDTIIPYSHTRY